MSFWENWKVEEPTLTGVVGIEEEDFDPKKALKAIAGALKDVPTLTKSITAQKLLNLAAENKNVQILFINMLQDGLDSAMQDALTEALTKAKKQ